MELKLAICPACKREIEVNSLEEVDFCKLCGKPFAVKDAVNLYTARVERDAAAKKPSGEVIAKFNAILAQDYKLAQRYLDDIVKKEYPKLDISFFPTENQILHLDYVNKYTTVYLKFDSVEMGFKNLKEANPWIAEMYYSLLKPLLNDCIGQKYNWTITGELSFLKFRLLFLETDLKEVVSLIDLAEQVKRKNDFELEKQYTKKVTGCWLNICNYINHYGDFIGKECDDEYIYHMVDMINQWSVQTHYSKEVGYSICCGKYIDDFLARKYISRINSISGLITCLESFLSSAEKKKLAEQRAAEVKRREKEKRAEEKRKKEEQEWRKIEKELAFWREYIELLKAGKAKEALFLLDKHKKPSQTDEFAKFKVGLFTVKYKGDVALLNAEMLAENSAAGNAKSSDKEKDSIKS